MTQIDPTAVRAAEKRLRSCAGDWRLFPYPTAPDDMKLLADAYLDLTDPTPLTVERLVGMGFTRNGQQYSFGDIRVDHVHDGVNGFKWWMMGVQSSPLIRPKPRTAGELRQLLMRMGK